MLNAVAQVRRQKVDPGIIYKGIVVDNDDPLKAYRVRCRIPGILDDLSSVEHYPWLTPTVSNMDGLTDVSGSAGVPKVNSVVGVKFAPNPDGSGSIYHGSYGPDQTSTDLLLKDMAHHYPNRKASRTANGTVVVVDTEDDSVWLYSPGETHAKSAGKLVIKSEETFVLLSDVEVGIRAPEIALRALDHLMLESEDKLTIRSKGAMNIECRDNIRVLARLNIDMEVIREQLRIHTRCEGSNGDIRVTSAKDSIVLHAQGKGGRTANVDITSETHNVNLEARTKDITMKAENDVLTTAQNAITTRAVKGAIRVTADLGNVSVTAKLGSMRLAAEANVLTSHGAMANNVTSDVIVFIAAPAVVIQEG